MRIRMRAATTLVSLTAVLSCSATGDSDGGRHSRGGNQGEGKPGETVDNDGPGSQTPGDKEDQDGKGPGLDDPGGGGAGGGDGQVCAGEVSEATPTVLSMLIMFDQSSSMKGARWDAVVNAVKGFVQAPEAAGIQVALSYFALSKPCKTSADCSHPFSGCPDGFCTFDDYCDASDYETPEVPFEAIPAVTPKILASLDAHKPLYNTTTKPALQGAINHAKARATSHPDEKVVVVFATDGLPDSLKCGESNKDIPVVVDIAKAGFQGTPSIPTYVIAVGPNLTALNDVAAGGGTKSAYLVSDSGAQKQFLDAMNDIREGAALPCEYAIPEPEKGVLDYDKVNVLFTPHGGSASAIGQVPSSAACGSERGWYYDHPTSPTKIHLCPATCSEFNLGQGGKVEVQLGCKTIVR